PNPPPSPHLTFARGRQLVFNGRLKTQVGNYLGGVTEHEIVSFFRRNGEKPALLTALVHVADGIAKEMGLGLVEDEAVDYNRTALTALHMKREDARALSKTYANLVKGEVRRLVKECMS
ncbi:MAG: hypothetical protein HOH74_21490, partial [Gemmatimonadetes bacterium]|nr:hypothetical protein [Gemmatimonadota bacterium]